MRVYEYMSICVYEEDTEEENVKTDEGSPHSLALPPSCSYFTFV